MDYHHIVTSFSPLLDLLLEPEQSDESLVRLREAIQAEELYVEVSPITVNSAIRYIELKYSSLKEQKRLTSELLEWVRVNSEHGIEYQKILEEANNLRPYPDSLAFEDIVNLVFAKEIGGGSVYLSHESGVIEKFIVDKALGLEYQELQVFNLESFAEWLDSNALLGDSKDFISVRTPAGDVIKLCIDPDTGKYPTPVDFAYRIHTSLGHGCQKAFVNGSEVSLKTPLQNNQVVQIIKGINQCPDRAWLEFVTTKKAKDRIRKWLKDKNIEKGKLILQQEFGNRYSLNGEIYLGAAQRLNCKNTLALLEQLGSGIIDIDRIKKQIELRLKRKGLIITSDNSLEVLPVILDVEPNQDIILANCCLPLPKDGGIIGIIGERNQKSLLRVHHRNCPNLKNIKSEYQQPLRWNCQFCTVEIQVTMKNRPNILGSITDKLTPLFGQNINILKVDAQRNPAVLDFHVLCATKAQLEDLKAELKDLSPDVLQTRVIGLSPGRTNFDKAIAH